MLARPLTKSSDIGSTNVFSDEYEFGEETLCYICRKTFHWWCRWRHHCRICFGAVCDYHSPSRVRIPGKRKFERACVRCAPEPLGEHPLFEDEHDDEEPVLCVDSFDFLRVVGRGAFGMVLLARQRRGTRAGALYALKIMRKSRFVGQKQMDRTKSERRILLQLKHPFLVRLRFAFQTDDKLFLGTDYYPGGTLHQHIRSQGQFSEEAARFYAAELLLALEHLHSLRIVYRDMKPENVLLDRGGHVALTDFGLSKENVTAMGGAKSIVGTAEYIAPELLMGNSYGASVDWWSFGILLYEMMNGKTPFFNPDRGVLFRSVAEAPLLFPCPFPTAARQLITSLLLREPSERLGSGPRGAEEIKRHPFFSPIDWDALAQRQIRAPFVPLLRSDTDPAYVPRSVAELPLPELGARSSDYRPSSASRRSSGGTPSNGRRLTRHLSSNGGGGGGGGGSGAATPSGGKSVTPGSDSKNNRTERGGHGRRLAAEGQQHHTSSGSSSSSSSGHTTLSTSLSPPETSTAQQQQQQGVVVDTTLPIVEEGSSVVSQTTAGEGASGEGQTTTAGGGVDEAAHYHDRPSECNGDFCGFTFDEMHAGGVHLAPSLLSHGGESGGGASSAPVMPLDQA